MIKHRIITKKTTKKENNKMKKNDLKEMIRSVVQEQLGGDSSRQESFEMLDEMKELMGADQLLDELARALPSDDLLDNLKYIDEMHELGIYQQLYGDME